MRNMKFIDFLKVRLSAAQAMAAAEKGTIVEAYWCGQIDAYLTAIAEFESRKKPCHRGRMTRLIARVCGSCQYCTTEKKSERNG